MPKTNGKHVEVAAICTNCGNAVIFRVGGPMDGPDPSLDVDSYHGQCFRCKASMKKADGSATFVISKVFEDLVNSSDPVKRAKEMIQSLRSLEGVSDLKAARRTGMLAKLKGIVPKSKKEVAIYIALIGALVKILSQKTTSKEAPPPTIQNVVNVYNQSVDLSKK